MSLGTLFVEVNGTKYTGFRSIEVKRSFTNLCGNFTLSTISDFQKSFPIKIGDKIEIYVDTIKIISGFIERLNVNYSADSHDLTFSGRDRTCDLVDSSLASNMNFQSGIDLVGVANTVFKYLNISTISASFQPGLSISPFGVGEIPAADVSKQAFSFIEELCRLRQVIPTGDGAGNIIFSRASTQLIKTLILHNLDDANNNVLTSSSAYDYTTRFNNYAIYSQSNPVASIDFEEDVQTASSKIGSSTDNEIRESRKIVLTSEQSVSEQSAQARANWEKSIRKAQSKQYNCTLVGFYATADGLIWQPNMLVKVQDQFAAISSELLINEVTYHYAVDRIDVDLAMVSPDSFEIVENPKAQRTNFDGNAEIILLSDEVEKQTV